MRKIAYTIGIFVLTVILYTIPILTVCSFIYNWASSLQFILISVSIIEFLILSYLLGDVEE